MAAFFFFVIAACFALEFGVYQRCIGGRFKGQWPVLKVIGQPLVSSTLWAVRIVFKGAGHGILTFTFTTE